MFRTADRQPGGAVELVEHVEVPLPLRDARTCAATTCGTRAPPLAAATGATLADLMARLGHSSPRAALIYQHATERRVTLHSPRPSRLAGGVKAT